jgi:hypothetical protein
MAWRGRVFVQPPAHAPDVVSVENQWHPVDTAGGARVPPPLGQSIKQQHIKFAAPTRPQRKQSSHVRLVVLNNGRRKRLDDGDGPVLVPPPDAAAVLLPPSTTSFAPLSVSDTSVNNNANTQQSVDMFVRFSKTSGFFEAVIGTDGSIVVHFRVRRPNRLWV